MRKFTVQLLLELLYLHAHQAMLRFGGSHCEEIVSVADGQLSTLECHIPRRLSFKWKMQDEIRLGQEADQ